MVRRFAILVVFTCIAHSIPAALAADPPHNIVLFIADGLRANIVSAETAPALATLREQGVNFRNGHALFPSFTTANASAMATGHYLGDTGNFSNTLFTGFPVTAADDSITPFIENDAVLGEVDQHFGGNYLNETTLLQAARDAGYATAAIGKLGPTLIFDHTERSGTATIIIDDATGGKGGIPLSPELSAALTAAGLPLAAPKRGDNGKSGNVTTPGTLVANIDQQNYFADAATKAVLPLLKAQNKPFVLIYWSRDPDGTQHNQGDSLNQLEPGINGPTSLAAVRNADDNLAKLRAALDTLGLAASTNIVVTADHGFSTISKESKTSPAAHGQYADVNSGFLPPGFLALDLASALKLPLFDPENKNAAVTTGTYPVRGNGLIGTTADAPEVVVAANGGSDLVYLPQKNKKTAARVIQALLAEDYVSGLFVDDALGKFPGTLPLSSINLAGSAITPTPAIVVNFRSFHTGCAIPENCAVAIADSRLQQGQGMHGSFSSGDIHIFMAALGPDFKSGFVDPAPSSNADVGVTLAHLLQLNIPAKGKLVGRVLVEAMPGGALPKVSSRTLHSQSSAKGLRTVLNYQLVGETAYFNAAGFPGRTVGLVSAKP